MSNSQDNEEKVEQQKTKKRGKEETSINERSSKLKGNRASNEVKAHAIYLVNFYPKNSARVVALSLKLEPRTVQRWYKTWKEGPDSLFKIIDRSRIIKPEGELVEKTRKVVAEIYYQQPTSTMDQVMNQLQNSFEGLTISKQTLYRYMSELWLFSLKRVRLEPVQRNTPERIQMRKEWVKEAEVLGMGYMTNCVFIDEAGFNANHRRTQGWAPKGQGITVKDHLYRQKSQRRR